MKNSFPWIASLLLLTGMAASAVEVEKHVVVFKEPGRFGGWPANHGAWIWGNEILVGFSRGYYKNLGDLHHIDRERPEECLMARSLDGGETWTIEDPSKTGAALEMFRHGTEPDRVRAPLMDCPGGIDFTRPDFAMTLRMEDKDTGTSFFYVTNDRGRTWEGPYRLPLFGQPGVMARTDYIIDGPHEMTVMLTAAKANNEEGRVFCARTRDGAKTWEFVGFVGPEPPGFAIMPSTVRLSEEKLLTAVRRREPTRRWNEAWVSDDNGRNWRFLNDAAPDLVIGNPPAMIRLKDGRVCLTYGVRGEPWEIRARLSSDEGATWSEEHVLRTGGGGRDIGYPRTVQRPDGKIVTLYYWHDKPNTERYIAATLWDPGSK